MKKRFFPISTPAWIPWLITAKLLLLVSAAVAVTSGERAPRFAATEPSGNRVELWRALDQKVVILYFWDVQFQICRQGLFELRDLQKKHRNRLTLFAVNINPATHTALENFKQHNSWGEEMGKLLIDHDGTAERYDAKLSLPVVCIINKEGRVVFYEQSFDKAKVKRAIKEVLRVDSWNGLWGQYVWAEDGLDNFEYRWGRGDVIHLRFLHEGRKNWTFRLQAALSYQKPSEYSDSRSLLKSEVGSGSATISLGPPPIKRWIGINFIGGAAGYRRLDNGAPTTQPLSAIVQKRVALESNSMYITPILGVGLRLYLTNWLSLYASREVDLRLDETVYSDLSVFHQEAGIRLYIPSKHSGLNIGYGEWRLGDRTLKGVQVAYGYVF